MVLVVCSDAEVLEAWKKAQDEILAHACAIKANVLDDQFVRQSPNVFGARQASAGRRFAGLEAPAGERERERPSRDEADSSRVHTASGAWSFLREEMAADMFSKALEAQILQTAEIVEEQLDAEIQKLDEVDEDELEILKQRRLEALKKAQQQKQDWLSKGHGEYREVPSERDFFQEVKGSKNVVCHFYRDTTYRCLIFDKHLTVLAKKHIETKFIKLNAEKSPFLCERLRIKVIPTLALLKDGKTQDYVVGFTDLGNTDDFTTETLEWRLGCAGVINYSGNLMDPPFQSQKKFGATFTKLDKKSIRGKKYDSDSDDD